MTKNRWMAATLFLVIALAGCSSGSTWKNEGQLLAGVDAQRAHTVVETLTSPEYAGRRTGTTGEVKAAAWLASQFQAAGLSRPSGSDGYLATYTAPVYTVTAFTGVTARGTAATSFLGDRAQAMPYAGNGTVEADAVLAGFGVSMIGYDEYAGVDVTGKVVLLLRLSAPSRAVPEDQTYLTSKVQRAAAHGALGVLILDVPVAPNPFAMTGQIVSAIANAPPTALVSVAGARSLFQAAGLTYDTIEQQALAGTIVSRDLHMTVRYSITADWQPSATAYNVVGVLPGRDTARQLLICAHHDHLGVDRTGALYPGADDNASGVATLLEVARSMASAGTPPVTVWFVSFSGEEEGMLGSQAFVKAQPELVRSLVAVIDLDMMRRTASTLGVSVKTDDQTLLTAVQNAIQDGASLSVIPWETGSDHEVFSQAGVPSCMLTGHGRETSWYHATTDIAADLPAADLGSAAQDALRLAWQLMQGT